MLLGKHTQIYVIGIFIRLKESKMANESGQDTQEEYLYWLIYDRFQEVYKTNMEFNDFCSWLDRMVMELENES